MTFLTRPILLSCALLAGLGFLGAPQVALAATNTGSTEVTVQASNENLRFKVPTIIPFAAAADGTLTGPSPEATCIENLSVFSIHVTNMLCSAENPWTLVANAEQSPTENSIDFQVGPQDALSDALAASQEGGMDVSHLAAWDLGYVGSPSSTIPLQTQGNIARSTGDIYHAADKVATISWTFEAGCHVEA